MENQPALRRSLGLVSATAVVAGSVIGSGVFMVAADISNVVPSPLGAIAVWAVAGIISLLGSFTLAELGCMYPGSGGPYLYLKEALGPLAGFLYGWANVAIIQTAGIAAIAVAFGQFLAPVLGLSTLGVKIVACLALGFFTALNLVGVRKSAAVLDLLTILKVVALVLVSTVGIYFSYTHEWISQSTMPSSVSISGFGVALIAAFWAYDGWSAISFMAGEIKNPQRNIPLALIGGVAAITLLYCLANINYYMNLSVADIMRSPFPASDAAAVWGGTTARHVLHVAIMLSVLGCLNGNTLAAARITYAMANDGVLPKFLGYVSPRFLVPTGALWAQLVIALLFVTSGTYDQLFTYVIAAAFVFYGLSAVALLVLRQTRPLVYRPYKVPLYPLLPLTYIAFCTWFLWNALMEKPKESLIGFALILVGVPVYYWQKSFSNKRAKDPLVAVSLNH